MTDLIVDHAPSIRNYSVELSGKGMVASAGRCKCVAHHLSIALATFQQLLADVKGSKGG